MQKYNDAMEEVLDEIESSLKDPRGLISHQRRLSFALSLGIVSLIEFYLKKLNVLKSGAKIDHRWLKKKKENVKEKIAKQITCPVESLNKLDEILEKAYDIEKERNKLAYGKKVTEENLKEKIDLFLEIKKRIEND